MDFNPNILIKGLPIVATSIDPRAGKIAEAVGELVASELAKAQAARPSMTLDDLIAEREEALANLAKSDADLDEGLRKARELRQKGHEHE